MSEPYTGIRSGEITLTGSFDLDALERAVGPIDLNPEREVRLTGLTPWPRDIHRGQALILSVNGERLEGRVKFRRRCVLVMTARSVR